MTPAQEAAIELALRREFGLVPKKVLVSVPLETLSRLTFTTGIAVGRLESYCQSPEDLIEADRLRRELGCLWSDLYRVD